MSARLLAADVVWQAPGRRMPSAHENGCAASIEVRGAVFLGAGASEMFGVGSASGVRDGVPPHIRGFVGGMTIRIVASEPFAPTC